MQRRTAAIIVLTTVLAAVLIISLMAFTGTFPSVVDEVYVNVGTYYYLWYGIPINNHWDVVISNYSPLLGNYNSDDQQIANQHVSWARDNEIGFLALSWLGTSAFFDHRYIDENLQEGLLKANLTDFEFCLFYETVIILKSAYDQNNKHVPDYSSPIDYFKEVWFNDTSYAASIYFNNQHYLHIKGKPVFIIYNVPFLCANLTSLAVNELLSNLRQQLNQSIYLVGDIGGKTSIQEFESDRHLLGLDWNLFDAVTSYLYSDPKNGWEVLLKTAAKNYPQLIRDFNERGISYFPNVYPGFKDADAPADQMILNVSPDMFAEMLRIAVDSVRNSEDDTKVVMITSWNEWHEATAIEPSNELGNQLIDIIKKATLP